MAQRNGALQAFVDAAFVAFNQFAIDPEARRSVRKVFSALQAPSLMEGAPGRRLPACAHLDDALSIATAHECLRQLIDKFRAIEPCLQWRRRTDDGSASANFRDGHANAMILGPGGYEPRNDAWLGASLLAPNVRYPNHDHAPEEVYLVLSEGEFQQGGGDWFSPGVGGSFYNEPGIRHAMRSTETPLFAFWALWTGRPRSENSVSSPRSHNP